MTTYKIASTTGAGFHEKTEPAKVFEDRVTPRRWRVEWFDDDAVASWWRFFTGPLLAAAGASL
jgi:hypothetical protein